MNLSLHSRWRYVLAAVAIGSTFPLTAPVLAGGTAAGDTIRNTATGTFTDGTTTYNTTSNEVTIVVSEIAGITVTAQPPSAATPNAGDTLYVEFLITNTGNDPTQFFIPGVATLSNTSKFSQNGNIQIVELNGTPLGTFVNVPNAGDTTGNLLGTGATQGSLPANPGTGATGTIKVRVPIKVLGTAIAGDALTVSLGKTTPANGQNQDRTGSIEPEDVYTVDNANGVGGETNATNPGVKEAMATSASIVVNARQQAFASVLKAVGSYVNNNTPNVLTDDVLTYRLALRVENPTTPPTGIVASDLYGTQLDVNNITTKPYVLVSDAIPAGLQLSATTDPTRAPGGWIPVYTQDPVTTTALKAKWTTDQPIAGPPITRVGFIYDTTTTPLSRGTVGIGNTISGFAFDLTPIGSFTGGQIANIAQVFGQSQPGAVVPGTPTQIVYDESGDQTANNGLASSNPDPTGGSAASGGISDGVANPTADGTDPGTGNDPTTSGTNQGTDGGGNGSKTVGGEDTVYTIAATPLNGPFGQPGAVGPTSNNDDYTNKSIVVPLNTSPSTPLTDAQTPPITFDNTAQNTSASSAVIALLPTRPDVATALPDNTKVTITDPATGNNAIYNYTSAGGFAFVSGTGATATSPVKLTIAGNSTANYKVTIDLPDAPQLTGFPVPITAFIDTNNDGSPANEPSNITIDRLYTNYVSLVKEARMLESNGTPVAGAAGIFTTNQADLSAAATPGRIIEYRITYKNISTSGGTNSVTLPANNLVITENGSAGTNTWFTTTFDQKYATSGGNGSAVDPGGTIAVTTSGTPVDIQTYTDTVPSVAPGSAGGVFIFQRTIK
ncbi:MAG: hypothetical protein KME13_07985 [Myxacorys californica WJT36-NPBG1]|jgi:hypothetical protein|nr:hypothetical protein [Myxacorys californica WJT36-NPBG1]